MSWHRQHTNDFSTAEGKVDLSPYLLFNPTEFFYCWNQFGLVTAQDTSATLDCTRIN